MLAIEIWGYDVFRGSPRGPAGGYIVTELCQEGRGTGTPYQEWKWGSSLRLTLDTQ